MNLPPIHYDWMSKRLPLEMEATRQALQSISTQQLTDGAGSLAWNRLCKNLGFSGSQGMFANHLFERCGQKVFAIGPKVSEALCSTNLSGVSASMLQAPAPCFYVSLPNSDWEIWGGDRTQWHRVSGFYVQKTSRFMIKNPDDPEYNYRHGLHFFIWGLPNKHSVNDLDDAVYWYSVPFADPEADLETLYGTTVPMREDPFGPYKDPWMKEDLAAEDPEIRAKHVNTARNVFTLGVNMMLYLSSQDPELRVQDRNEERKALEAAIGRATKEGKRKKLTRRLNNLPKTVITYIGEGIENASGGGGGGGTVDERSVPRAHFVRPHWHHYWIGKKGSQTKVRRWIHMYERGSGEADRTITKFREPSE